jgi:hypothetical protein
MYKMVRLLHFTFQSIPSNTHTRSANKPAGAANPSNPPPTATTPATPRSAYALSKTTPDCA